MYTYDAGYRYHLVRDHAILSSPAVTLSLLAAGIAAALAWLTLIFLSTAPLAIAATIITSTLVAALLLAHTYSATYYPYVTPHRTVQQLVGAAAAPQRVNTAAAASFALLRALGPAARGRSGQELKRSLRSLIFSAEVQPLMRRLGLDRQATIQAIEQQLLPALSWPEFAADLLQTAAAAKHLVLMPAHALGSLLRRPELQAYLRSLSLTEEDVMFALWWEGERLARRQQRRAWWRAENLLSFTGVGLSWAAGYTPFVDRFARIPHGSFWDNTIHGHEAKLEELINSLARQRQSNVLLVGDPGVGRLGIIRSLAAAVDGARAHRALNGQRVIYLNIGDLIARGSSGASQLTNVSIALQEIERAGNIIAVLDGLSSILGQSGEQRLNLTDILVPFLSSATVRVVVMISSTDYHLRFKSNDALAQYFEVVQVPSLSSSATLQRIALTLPAIERAAGLYIPYQTIRAVVEDTGSIMPHIPFPERAFDFLEEAIVLAQSAGARVLKPEHIHAVIAQKVGVRIGYLKTKEKEQLLNLEELMHRRLVNQNQAVRAVSRALVRARAETRSLNRPIGSFLFLGPTGVGKTETAKTLAAVYFGSEEHLTRLDMSEFQGADAADRLIGSISQPTGRLTSLIAAHPFTVLLLDEFEKASSAVHQLFLQVLDEGRLTDVSGRRYSFQHAIIIATSNAGAELIRQHTKSGKTPEGFDEILKEHILSQNVFRPELLNRFDAVITYTPLTPEQLREVAKLMLRSLNRRLDAQHGVTVRLTDELIDFLISIGYDPQFGARPMTRAIQDTVEYAVAQQILRGDAQPGQQITLSPAALRGLRS